MFRLTSARLAVVLVLSGCTTPMAVSNPAVIPWPVEVAYLNGEAECPRTLPSELLTVGGLRLGGEVDADFADAVRLFGPSPLRHAGDAGDSLSWRCWSAANGDGTVFVALTGLGSWEELRVIGPDVVFPGRAQCPKSKKIGRWLATDNGIHLGLTKKRVRTLAGGLTKTGRGWFERMCFSTQKMTPSERAKVKPADGPDYFNVASWFRGVFDRGHMVGFSAGWSKTWN